MVSSSSPNRRRERLWKQSSTRRISASKGNDDALDRDCAAARQGPILIMKNCILALPLFLSMVRAQDAPTPPDDGPSLEVTMKFIQDKLNGAGPSNWAGRLTDGDTIDLHSEVLDVLASTSACTLSFRARTSNSY